MQISNGKAKKPKSSSCPICKKSVARSFRPFCSKRCADVDLSRWLNGHYAIPVTEEDGAIPTPFGNENSEE